MKWFNHFTSTGTLEDAVRRHNSRQVRRVLERGVTQAELDSCIGPAVHAGLSVLQMLVEHGANINERNKQAGRTPLHHAAGSGYLDIAEYLIENGADVNAVDHEGETPLDQALGMPIEQQFFAYAEYSTGSPDGDTKPGRAAVGELLKSRGGRRGRIKVPEGLFFQLRLARPTASEEELTRQYIVRLIDSNINPFINMLPSIFEQECKRYPELVALARDCFGQDNVPACSVSTVDPCRDSEPRPNRIDASDNAVPAFLVIGNRERPTAVLGTLKRIDRLRADLAALSGFQPRQCKVLLCHGEIVRKAQAVDADETWHAVFHFCSQNGVTLAVDPYGALSGRDVRALFSLALGVIDPFSLGVLFVLSADGHESSLDGIAAANIAGAIRAISANPGVRVGVDMKRNILIIPSASRHSVQLPNALLDDTWPDLLNWVWRFAKMSQPGMTLTVSL